MIDLSVRSNQLELLDQPDIPTPDLYQNLKELHTINTLLGGYQVMLKGVEYFLQKYPQKEVTILDIGSGGGDTLKVIHQQFGKKFKLKLIGVDLKGDCINYSRENCKDLPIEFIESDYRDLLKQENDFDIIVSSLFCHHLKENDLVSLFQWMRNNAKMGGVVNDLHRHHLAYYSIKWITQVASSSYLVKNDACLSVARSFRKEDWKKIFQQSNIKAFRMKWMWAFRWLITFDTKENV
ncbi:methyltransferase domain-containing protein [Flammeovirga agarivorans]|uniref:Methyltransferase domain-containing protein n=1 Tax=Flammeovirga agarivorans TaxID=2726742 RepID=A0A7X8SNR8_9BACT|nr:methyltransferase domain-containing protein [Flammeovirga agarivorans]NLR93613.1 methyltransferase domain-containing protein [Flammeovirga agarivorans]